MRMRFVYELVWGGWWILVEKNGKVKEIKIHIVDKKIK